MNDGPCHGCKDRKPAKYVDGKLVEPCCHSYCELHEKWKKRQIDEQRKRRTLQEYENTFRGYKVETAERNKKRRRRGGDNV